LRRYSRDTPFVVVRLLDEAYIQIFPGESAAEHISGRFGVLEIRLEEADVRVHFSFLLAALSFSGSATLGSSDLSPGLGECT